jgi:c-di-GMP-binding flagellar brake protein YcgR
MADNDKRLDPSVERRAAKRFPIEQDVFYKVLDHRVAVPESGSGKTLDISSGGVLFETEQRLRAGKRVELSVNWPAELENGCPLKFMAFGRVVRADDNTAAVHIEQYEFRTRRKESTATAPEKIAHEKAAPEKQAPAPVPYY